MQFVTENLLRECPSGKLIIISTVRSHIKEH